MPKRISIWAIALLCTACAPAAAPSAAISQGGHGPPASASPSATGAVRASLSDCPASSGATSLPELAAQSGDPDDISVAPNGVLWLSDRDGDRVLELDPSGRVLRAFPDAQGPEGIAVLGGGMLLVAQQIPDRIDMLDTATGAFRPWLQLGAAGPTDGLDGIALDGATLLVPDSAHGRLLSVGLGAGDAAQPATLLASGLGRPVDAVADPSGGYDVVAENAPGLIRVSTGGSTSALTQRTSLDDVVSRDGLLYATDLAAGSLIAVDPSSGAARTLVTGAPSPQGLALRGDGTLLLVDSTLHRIVEVPSCG